jgi:hypothetical protein
MILLDAMLLGSFSTWLGCMFVTCMLLDAKGRSGVGGFFAYLVFPIAALIYAAAVPSLPPRAKVVSTPAAPNGGSLQSSGPAPEL